MRLGCELEMGDGLQGRWCWSWVVEIVKGVGVAGIEGLVTGRGCDLMGSSEVVRHQGEEEGSGRLRLGSGLVREANRRLGFVTGVVSAVGLQRSEEDRS